MKENKLALYFYLILGTVGTVLIALAALNYQTEEVSNKENLTFLIGFGFIFGYINYLEKKAEISKKLTWLRFIGFIILFISFVYFI